jgi:hypothetical protein
MIIKGRAPGEQICWSEPWTGFSARTVADLGQLDPRQCWDAAERRLSHTRVPPNCDRFCHAILDRSASSHPPVVHVTVSRPASDRPVILGPAYAALP